MAFWMLYTRWEKWKMFVHFYSIKKRSDNGYDKAKTDQLEAIFLLKSLSFVR